MKRAGRVWIRVFPDVPVSKKPAEVRMGSGKGAPEYWIAKIKPGRILFEVDGVDHATAKEAMRLGAGQAFDSDQIHCAKRVKCLTMAKKSSIHKTSAKKQKLTAKSSSKADDLRGKSADELGSEMTKLKKESFNLRIQRANGQLEKTGRIRGLVRRNHRPHPNGFDGAAPQGRLKDRGIDVCPSACCKASWSATRTPRRWW